MKPEYIIAVDAGGQSFKYALLSCSDLSNITEPKFFPIESDGDSESILNVWRSIIRDAYSEADSRGLAIKAMACSCPGPMDYLKGISLMTHKWASIKGIDLRKDFYSHGLKEDVPVYFCHDGHSLILGEAAKGNARGYKRIGGFIIGTGLGFGAYCDGNLIADEKGCPIFGLFRKPFKGEPVENFASSKGVPRLYSEISGKECNLTAKDIGQMADEGNPLAIRTYETMGKIIATVSAPIIAEYKFDCLVFGGRISNSFEVFEPAFKAELETHEINVPALKQSIGGELLAMTGASYYAKRRMEDEKAF